MADRINRREWFALLVGLFVCRRSNVQYISYALEPDDGVFVFDGVPKHLRDCQEEIAALEWYAINIPPKAL